MNEHDDEIGGGGRVDPDAITDTGDVTKDRWHLTGRAALRAWRYGHNTHNPNRSRCQRKTPKQRAHGPTGDAAKQKAKRRTKRTAAWLAAEHDWNEAAA